jgi:hypothetical protein
VQIESDGVGVLPLPEGAGMVQIALVTVRVGLRSLVGFVQIVLLLDRVYNVKLPPSCEAFLAPLRVLSLDRLYTRPCSPSRSCRSACLRSRCASS